MLDKMLMFILAQINAIKGRLGVDFVVEQGGKYTLYNSGIAIQWGTLTFATGSNMGTVTFPKSFIDQDYSFTATGGSNIDGIVLENGAGHNRARTKSSTIVSLGQQTITANYARNFSWIAIGRWK